MKVRNSFLTIAGAIAAFCATAANAQLGKPTESRPVIADDIVGKKICWSNGGFTMFGAGGQFTNSAGKHRVWLVTEPGIVKIGNGYHQIQILPDGSFYQHKFLGGIGSITGHLEWWGSVCN
jgi:hypothetical protein